MAPVLRLAAVEDYEIRLLPVPQSGDFAMKSLCPAWPEGAGFAAFPTMHRVPSQGYAFSLARPPKFAPEKARALATQLAEELQHSASFYFNFYDWASEEFETAGYYIYMLADELKKGGDTELAAGITARFSDMIEAAGV